MGRSNDSRVRKRGIGRVRARRLFALRAASQQEVEGAETDLHAAETTVIKAQSELEKQRIHLTEFLGLPVEEKDHGGTSQFIATTRTIFRLPLRRRGDGVPAENYSRNRCRPWK